MNGQTSWISSTNAIWFDPSSDDWIIGLLDNLGDNKGTIVSHGNHGVSSCPSDIANDQWKYYNGESWVLGDANEISLECSKGNNDTLSRK